MAAYPDPPVEWVRGGWFRVAWFIAYVLASVASIFILIREYQTLAPSTFVQYSLYFDIWAFALVFVNLPVIFYSPTYHWIGLSPNGLYVRSFLRTEVYPWGRLYRTSPTLIRTDPPGNFLAGRIRLSRRQADRLTRFWTPAPR